MYHLPGGAAQGKKEKGRTCARNFARNVPKLRPKLSRRAAHAGSGGECSCVFASAQADPLTLQTIEDWSNQAPHCVLRSYVCMCRFKYI